MKKLLFSGVCLLALFVGNAQTDPPAPPDKDFKPMITSIRTIDNILLKGAIYNINDSQIVLVRSFRDQQVISAENIQSFSLKRKNSALRGALIGLGIGAVTGIVIGLASGDDKVNNDPVYDPISAIIVGIGNAFTMTAGEKAVAGGLGLGATGAIAGAIIGAIAKKKFTIGGNKQKFRDLQSEIMMKLVQK